MIPVHTEFPAGMAKSDTRSDLNFVFVARESLWFPRPAAPALLNHYPAVGEQIASEGNAMPNPVFDYRFNMGHLWLRHHHLGFSKSEIAIRDWVEAGSHRSRMTRNR